MIYHWLLVLVLVTPSGDQELAIIETYDTVVRCEKAVSFVKEHLKYETTCLKEARSRWKM